MIWFIIQLKPTVYNTDEFQVPGLSIPAIIALNATWHGRLLSLHRIHPFCRSSKLVRKHRNSGGPE